MNSISQLENLFPGIHNYAEKAIKWRNHIHQHPELSFEEFQTASFVEDVLFSQGFKSIKRMAGTGLVTTLHENQQLDCVALRADLDALPIQESATKINRSLKNGIMHACGHDAHTACLLGAAAYLLRIKDKINLNVKFIFQPGEEKLPGGASMMINEGVLNYPKVSAIYGLHVTPDLQTGQFGLRAGAFMASTDELHIKIVGRPGHAAMYNTYINPVVVGSSLIHHCMNEVNLKIPGLGTEYVLAFGAFNAAGATNVIPSEANIKGTLRTFNESVRTKIHELLIEISKSLSAETGADILFDIQTGYPVLYNDPSLTEKTSRSLGTISKPTHNIITLERRMTAEDFAWYSQKIPSCFIRWGTGNHDKGIDASVHTPDFDIDDQAIVYGIAAFLQCVMQHNQ